MLQQNKVSRLELKSCEHECVYDTLFKLVGDDVSCGNFKTKTNTYLTYHSITQHNTIPHNRAAGKFVKPVV